METSDETSVLAFAGGLLLTLAVLRVVWLFVGGGDPTPDVWRRRWLEVGGIIVVGLALVLVDVAIG